MFRLLFIRKVEGNILRTVITFISIIIAVIIPIFSSYCSFIQKVFEKEQNNNIVVTDTTVVNLKTFTVSGEYQLLSDSFFRMLRENPKIEKIRKLYVLERIRSYVSVDRGNCSEVHLTGVYTDDNGLIFPWDQLCEFEKKGQKAIIAGREFCEGEKKAMMVSNYDCHILGYEPEEIVGKKALITDENNSIHMEVEIVGVYDNFLSDSPYRKTGGDFKYNTSTDYIFTADVPWYFDEKGGDSPKDPTRVDVSMKNFEDAYPMISYIKNEYGIAARSIATQLLGITMIMKEYSRIFGVIGGFAYLVVGAMLFSVIYRNMKEHQATRTILNNLGMTEKKIKKFERREIAIYGIIGVVTGGALAVAICIIFGRSALIGKPEFQTLKDVCPNVVTVLVPILIFLLLYAIISEIVLLLTYKKEKEDGYEKN